MRAAAVGRVDWFGLAPAGAAGSYSVSSDRGVHFSQEVGRLCCLLSGSAGLGSVSRPLNLLVVNDSPDFPKRCPCSYGMVGIHGCGRYVGDLRKRSRVCFPTDATGRNNR